MKVPFVDLGRFHKEIADELAQGMQRVVQKGDFILGKDVAEFEKEFAAFCGSSYAVGVGSGTDALHLALLALGIGPGDEVITAANTFIATVLAISYTGAQPVLVDMDPATYTISVEGIRARITSKTKAIIPVHLYGYTADMDAINALAQERGLKVVEDACQAHGATYCGKKAGSLGDIGCFSFYPGKNLGAFGDGGMVVTSDPALYEKVLLLRNYGSKKKYEHDLKGFNSRLDTLQAVVLRTKLPRLETWNASRRAAAARYTELLAGTSYITPPADRPGCEAVYHLYVIRTKERDALRDYLKEKGIDTGIHYPIPIHRCPAYADLGLKPGDLPVTEQYADEILSLPMFPYLTEQEITYTIEALKAFKG